VIIPPDAQPSTKHVEHPDCLLDFLGFVLTEYTYLNIETELPNSRMQEFLSEFAFHNNSTEACRALLTSSPLTPRNATGTVGYIVLRRKQHRVLRNLLPFFGTIVDEGTSEPVNEICRASRSAGRGIRLTLLKKNEKK
jgi:hypothetical protein